MDVVAVDPRTGSDLGIHSATPPADVARLAALAAAAAADPRLADRFRRAEALRMAAARLADEREELLSCFEGETGLPRARAETELARTCGQLEAFGSVVEAGDHFEPIIDRANPDAKPAARPDLRRMLVPVGPVAVFGASNFPLAFGVPGGDTASALAAGCPVLVKGHPSQPGVNALCGRLVEAAVRDSGLPDGSFATVQGSAPELGEALVDAPEVAAVGFTGSFAGGRALSERAVRRPTPIPVFAEMGSTNPVVVTDGALRAQSETIAEGLAGAITGAAGQLCTRPGVVLVPATDSGDAFCREVGRRLATSPLVMLNERLRDGFAAGARARASLDGVDLVTTPPEASGPGFRHTPVAVTTSATELANRPELREELFGPAVTFARYASPEELLGALRSFDGQLAGALHSESSDDRELVAAVSHVLAERAGRVVFDGFPTGVAVTWAMHHGGPYPATTAPAETSVGMTATRRFLRPICWQDAPQDVLPEPLRDANPDRIWRRVDGTFTQASLDPSAGAPMT
jgi:acyl-CoA reductase-like NAD-dependent aldehyde dehydrogenase